MENIELKHLAPYLPYGLNVMHTEKNMMLIISGAYLKANTDKYFTFKLLNWDLKVMSNECKPILRPLSDVYSLFTFNDKRISFWLELGVDSSRDDLKRLPKQIIIENEIDLKYRLKGFASYTYFKPSQINILFKYHFDVFGLIEKGLAIDINTIK